MKKWITRLLIGLAFAIPFMLFTTVWAQAQDASPVEEESGLDCQQCHPAFYASWENSHHGQSLIDPEFEAAWDEQGRTPECLECHVTGYDRVTRTWEDDSISCQACHGPIDEDHPANPMPADRSAELCGTCHTETLFEWQVSAHRETDLTCVDCHGQHSTELKADDSQALCTNCHRERASNYSHTAHSEQGLSCADCHLGPTGGDTGGGHAVRDHSFNVRLSTCNACHAYQMHDPTEVHMDEFVEPELDAMASVEVAGVSVDPEPVSPFYYALLSALVGMAFGLLVSPWIERWYNKITKDVTEVEK